jgi:DNA-binding ferritin-like protein
MDDRTIANMRSRVARCRQLADSTTDPRTATILRQMADEGEADIWRLESEQEADEEAGSAGL